MSIKKLENGCIWGKEVYIVRSKPLKPINPKHKMGTWCGYNIILTEDRFGKISKGSINTLKKRIEKRLKGKEPLTSSELEKVNEEIFYKKNAKYHRFYTENKEKLIKRFFNIIKSNRIETELVKDYKNNLFYIRIYASHSILLALLHSIDRTLKEDLFFHSDNYLGCYEFWKYYFKDKMIDDNYFDGRNSDKRYLDICFKVDQHEDCIISFLKIPYEKYRETTYLKFGHGIRIYNEGFYKLIYKIHPNKELLIKCLGFDLDLYCKELIKKQTELKLEQERLRAEEKEILTKIKRNEELLKIIVESASLEFLNQTIKPLIFKRLGVSLNIDVNKLKTMPYREYLKTDHWKNTSREAKKRADYKCQLCGYDKYLNVHHNDYSRRGEELPSDLIVLCKTCHAKFHDKL